MKKRKIPGHLAVKKKDVFKSTYNMVQTCGQKETPELRWGLPSAGEKGRKLVGWTKVKQERNMPGRSTLDGDIRMVI